MDKSAQIKIIKAKIALLDAEKEQLLKKLVNIEKETAPSTDFPLAILENPSNQPRANISYQLGEGGGYGDKWF